MNYSGDDKSNTIFHQLVEMSILPFSTICWIKLVQYIYLSLKSILLVEMTNS